MRPPQVANARRLWPYMGHHILSPEKAREIEGLKNSVLRPSRWAQDRILRWPDANGARLPALHSLSVGGCARSVSRSGRMIPKLAGNPVAPGLYTPSGRGGLGRGEHPRSLGRATSGDARAPAGAGSPRTLLRPRGGLAGEGAGVGDFRLFGDVHHLEGQAEGGFFIGAEREFQAWILAGLADQGGF